MKYSKKDILQIANDEGVNYIRLVFTSLLGTVKNVEVPITQLEKALDNNVMFDGSSIEGFVRIHESDMYLYPDLNTWLIFPWQPGEAKIARLICDVYTADREPFPGDPRGNLKRVIREMNELGFSQFNLGPEPEFFLFKLDEQGNPTTELNDHGGYFDYAPLDLAENCRRDIVLELEKMGFEIEASHHEVAPGQHEIDFKFTGVLKACDDIQDFKLIVKSIARRHGLYATFMPKPIFNINGSGMHCNVSLFDREGKNAFYDENSEIHLSKITMYFIAGIIKHAKAITAVANPTINSYKRLVPGYEAPTNIAWSPTNRSPLIRIPASRGVGTRIEIRSVDPSSNPYLGLAAILAAGLDGIKNKLEAPDPVDDNLYKYSVKELREKGIDQLPTNLKEALDELENDEVIKKALGKHIYKMFRTAKLKEWEEFQMIVHEWEYIRYMSLL